MSAVRRGIWLVALLLAGCTTVAVPPAPHAADPDCAAVVLALPADLPDLPRLRTNSQATVAWGDPAGPVVLRCGVEPPGPTTEACVTAADERASVDWLAVPAEDGSWTFTTYGRDPAVEVHLPAAVVESRSTSFLLDLGPAVSRVPATRSCL